MKGFGFIFLILSQWGFASNEPYMVETKVQTDLDNILSRTLPKEQFLVQVNADVVIKAERKLMEGESLASTMESKEIHVPPMPGFVPEVEIKDPGQPLQTRQVYRTIETPELKSLRVYVRFDDAVLPALVTKAKGIIQDYLNASYPKESILNVGQMSMLKIPKETPKVIDPTLDPLTGKKKEEPKVPPPFEEQLWGHARWGILGILFVLLLLAIRRSGSPELSLAGASTGRSGGPSPDSHSDMGHTQRDFRSFFKRGSRGNTPEEEESSEYTLGQIRKRLIEKFLSRAESFRMYFNLLNEEQKTEIWAALQGPAFESFMEGIGTKRPPSIPQEVPEMEDRMKYHEKHFDEFVQAKDWKDKQFFGFLHHMPEEQLLSLIESETPVTASVILRFMKPQQSAQILSALPAARQLDIITNTSQIHKMPFSELTHIERDVRNQAQKIPSNVFASNREDVDFWGDVLSETPDQEKLLDVLEQTNPHLVPHLKKFRFNLEDAASLPNSILEKVLRNFENQDLCMALSACSPDVAETLLDAVSPNRRQHLAEQIESLGQESREHKHDAKLLLTKKIREAIA